MSTKIFCRKMQFSAVCSGVLRIMNGSSFLDDLCLSGVSSCPSCDVPPLGALVF